MEKAKNDLSAKNNLLKIAISDPIITKDCKNFIHIHPGHIRAIEWNDNTTIIQFTTGQRSFPSTYEHHTAIIDQWRELLR